MKIVKFLTDLKKHLRLIYIHSQRHHDQPLPSVIQSDPDILGGTPVFIVTRVPVKNLFDYLAAGESFNKFLHHFPNVKSEQAIAVLQQLKR